MIKLYNFYNFTNIVLFYLLGNVLYKIASIKNNMYLLKSQNIILLLAYNTFIIFNIESLRKILFRNAKRIKYFTCKYENLMQK